MDPHPATAAGVAPWSARRVVTTVLVVLGTQMTATVASALAASDAPEDHLWLYAAGWLLGCTVLVSLVVRHRWPVVVCLLTAASAVALPVDAVGALVAFSWVVTRRRDVWLWVCGAATVLATGVALTRDRSHAPENTLLALNGAGGGVEQLPVAAYVLVGVIGVVVAVLWGLLRRSREGVRDAEGRAHVAADQARRLRHEMSRQEEREVIAREVHDTVAHQLSLVSLQAAALEVSVGDEQGSARQVAAGVRAAAHQALEQLHGLVAVLRDPHPGVGFAALPGASLADLPALLDRAREAGAPVHATVFVADADTAAPDLTRAVYRIVQESLTNTLKHAPGHPVTVEVRVGPEAGAWVRVTNPAGPGGQAGHGAGSGIPGMQERARLLGGELTAQIVEGRFVVEARLPWVRGTAVSEVGPTVTV